MIPENGQVSLFLMFNASTNGADFALPPATRVWMASGSRYIRRSAKDLFAAGEEPLWEDSRTYRLSPRSSAILLVRETNSQRKQTELTEFK